MNGNLNLCEILKDCPKGTKFYSPLLGDCEFVNVCDDYIIVHAACGRCSINANGTFPFGVFDSKEIMLFPSREQRDWSKFNVKKPKFDPKTLKAFDMVLVKMKEGKIWYADIISVSANENKLDYCTITIGDADYDWVIPYNDDTKHLVGTTEEAPEFYRYWEE